VPGKAREPVEGSIQEYSPLKVFYFTEDRTCCNTRFAGGNQEAHTGERLYRSPTDEPCTEGLDVSSPEYDLSFEDGARSDSSS
jgi:hypothetical protein